MTFAEQVKAAREQLSLSQHAFAKELKVSFSTINRWENRHNEPHEAVKSVFFDYCEKRAIIFDCANEGEANG